MRINMRNPENSDFSILTLDDDPIMTATIQTYFQNAGYMVDAENDPHVAIERIRGGNYDILLLDFFMPSMLLFGLMIYVTWNDIVRFVVPFFQ